LLSLEGTQRETVMRNTSRILVSALCGVILVSSGFAQEEPDSTPFEFAVTVKGMTTDNRDSAPDGVEDSNTDLFVTPRLDFVMESERTVLDLYYAPSYRYRSDPSDIQNEDEFFHELALSVKHQADTRLALRAKETYNYTDDPEVDRGGVTLRRDSSYSLNRVEAGLNYAIDRRTSVDVSGRHMVKSYDEDVAQEESDEDMLGGLVGLRRQVARTVAVSAFADYRTYDSESLENLDRGLDTVVGGVGIEKQFSEDLKGDLLVGWQSTSYENSAIDDDDTPYLRVGAEVSPNPDTVFKVYGSYSLENAYSYPYVSQERTQFHARLEWDASPKVSLAFSGEYRLEDYEKDTAPESPAAGGGDETTLIAKAQLAYKLAHGTSLALVHLYEDVDSDVYVSFTRNATSLALTQRF